MLYIINDTNTGDWAWRQRDRERETDRQIPSEQNVEVDYTPLLQFLVQYNITNEQKLFKY